MNSRYIKVTLLVLFLIGFINSYGQEFVYPVNITSRDMTIEIRVGYTKLQIKGSEEKVIKIKLLNGSRSNDKRAEGLTPVTPWPDNTGIGIHFSEKDNIINLVKTTPRSEASYEITVPDWVNLSITENEWSRGDFRISGISGNISIETNSSDISLNNIKGSVETETTSGNVEIEIPPAGIGTSYEISSVSGTTSLLIEKDSPYSFDLSTVSGTIQTEFELVKEIDYKGSKLKRISKPKEIITDLNGGGNWIEASTVSGMIDISFIK